MPSSDNKKILFFFTSIIAVNFIIYFPSLSHIPRSDHFVYLANIAQENDWISLAWKHYALNREDLTFGMKDQLLFRPLVYLLLGSEKYFFGYEFVYWQATGILLHIIALWFLLKILWRIYPGISAAITCLFFSVLLANVELVTWHHVHGYLLCIIFILIAFNQVLKWHQTAILTRKTLFILFISLLFACFSHEIGSVYSLLFAFYFLFSFEVPPQSTNALVSLKKPLLTKNKYLTSLTIALPCLIYFAIYLLDLYHRGQWLTAPSHAFQPTNIFYGLRMAFVSLFWWAYIGLFPTLTFTEFAQRTFMYPLFIHIEGYTFEPSMPLLFPALLSLGMIIFYIVYLKKYMTVRFVKNNYKIWVLLLSMLFSFAFLVCYGRATVRGFERIMVDNGSYNYFFWVFFTILIYISIPFHRIKQIKWPLIKVSLIFAMAALIFLNSFYTFKLNTGRTIQSHRQASLIRQIKKLINTHSTETDFSFAIHPDNIRGLVKYPKRTEPLGHRYNIAELLYPQYYNTARPKYILRYHENTGWAWKNNKN